MNDKTIAELRDFRNDLSGHPCLQMILDGILSRAEAAKDEPLAVLANRKGVSFEVCPPSFYVHNVGVWDIGIGEPKKGLYTPFDGPTYEACVAKTRAYLSSLPDVRGGRRV